MTERNPQISGAAERLLDSAMQLFAEKGYARTTVGDIQQRAGLTFGSGALYKHFPSKEAVLTEGVDRFVESARSQRRVFGGLGELPLGDALATLARMAMASFGRDKDTLRIVWRDLDPFPELQEKVRTERIRASFDDFASWLGQQADGGEMKPHDSQAVAAVALGSLAFFQIHRFLLHDTPAGIDEERFVRAWSEVFTAALS
jgi:AcrR family transcriptional regulator